MGAWWAAVYGVAQSRTRLKRLSSSSSSLRWDPETKLKNIHFKKSVSNNYYCCCSLTHLCLTLTCQASPSFTISWSLLKLMSIESVMPSSHLILCRPLLLLPSIFPSIRVFSSESALCFRWPKYWSFSFSISPSNEYSGFIFFRIDWFDSLIVTSIEYLYVLSIYIYYLILYSQQTFKLTIFITDQQLRKLS